jgi:RNA polymerase sigma factor (sigma-70 family)
MGREDAEEALAEAIEELPAAQRNVLVATELEGRSFRELAEEWKTPIGTLLARKHRAVQALREQLTGGDE